MEKKEIENYKEGMEESELDKGYREGEKEEEEEEQEKRGKKDVKWKSKTDE